MRRPRDVTPTPRVEARWQKPLIAASGGEATLLVRVLAAAVDEAEAGRAAPLDVAFVLDRSGSMQGDKLDLAKEGVDLAVARLRDADRAALIVYDDEVDTVQPLAPATPRLKASLRLALHGVDSGGSTYLSGGWIAGCHQLAEATPVSQCGRHGNPHPARHPAHRWVGQRRHSRSRGAGAPRGRAAAARHRHDHGRRGTGLRRGTAQRHG